VLYFYPEALMPRRTRSLVVVAILLGATGCGGRSDGVTKTTGRSTPTGPAPETPENLMTAFLSDVDAVSGAMEKKEPKETVDALFQKAEATNKKLRELSISTEDKKKLEDRFRAEIEKTMARYFRVGGQYAAAGNPVSRFTGMGSPPTQGK
jgi:hypothetical protein